MSEVRLQIFNTIQTQHVPSDLVLNFFKAIYSSAEDFWLFRRQFAHSFASLTFLTYIMFMTARYPHRYNISRCTGSVVGSDLIPTLSNQKPAFSNNEPVPFRLTPNIQRLIGPIAMEGVFAPAIMAIARSLTEPEHELRLWLRHIREGRSHPLVHITTTCEHGRRQPDHPSEGHDVAQQRHGGEAGAESVENSRGHSSRSTDDYRSHRVGSQA